ncbi:MAG: hypothetical protein R2843_02720 [Thermomicrobiales bacterium]
MIMGAAENESGDSTGWKRLVSVAFLVQFFSMMGVSVVFAFLPLYVEQLAGIVDPKGEPGRLLGRFSDVFPGDHGRGRESDLGLDGGSLRRQIDADPRPARVRGIV